MKGSGEITSVAQGRSLLRRSFDVIEYLPSNTGAWNEAYAKYTKISGRN